MRNRRLALGRVSIGVAPVGSQRQIIRHSTLLNHYHHQRTESQTTAPHLRTTGEAENPAPTGDHQRCERDTHATVVNSGHEQRHTHNNKKPKQYTIVPLAGVVSQNDLHDTLISPLTIWKLRMDSTLIATILMLR